MAIAKPALKKSVTIYPEVFDGLVPERRANLSATVNEGLELLSALDAQRALVEEWEAEHGDFTEDELAPFLEVALRAQLANVRRQIREARAPRSAAQRLTKHAAK